MGSRPPSVVAGREREIDGGAQHHQGIANRFTRLPCASKDPSCGVDASELQVRHSAVASDDRDEQPHPMLLRLCESLVENDGRGCRIASAKHQGATAISRRAATEWPTGFVRYL